MAWQKVTRIEQNLHKNKLCYFLFFNVGGKEFYTMLTQKAYNYWKQRLKVQDLNLNNISEILVFRVRDTPLYQIVEMRLEVKNAI